MASVADKLGFGPKREIELNPHPNLGATIHITPPKMMGEMPTQKVKLTEDQYRRYKTWANGPELIQNALPDLSPSQREMLMTGLGDEDFHEIAKSLDDKEPKED